MSSHGTDPASKMPIREGAERTNDQALKVGRFGHMFPSSLARPKPVDDAALKTLADAMIDDRPPGEDNNRNVPAGYTYLGQFIDHDITLDLTSTTEARRDPLGEQNFRTPQLELDSLYATGPGGDASPHLFDRLNPGRMLVGRCGAGGPGDPDVKAGLPFDLARNAQGIALIGDARNDENLLVSQTHLAFLKFHNAVLAQHGGGDFGETRKLVRWHYQWIVLHDFLAKLIDNNDLSDVLRNGRRHYLPEVQSDYHEAYIPVEFSGAAYRLGHSMVRETYSHNRAFRPEREPTQRAGFAQLFHFTGKSGGILGEAAPPFGDPANGEMAARLRLLLPFVLPSLPGDWIIDWHRFYDLGEPPAPPPQANPQDNGFRLNFSRLIDPYLVPALHELPGGGGSLPLRNLQRGYKLQLPSGQAVARHMAVPVLDGAQIAASGKDGAAARAIGLHEESPLWFYILKEAQLMGNGGNRLGPVGSRILAEVFVGLLQTDPEAFLHPKQNPGWKPTLPAAHPGTFTMPDMLRYVDQAEPGFLDPIGAASSF